MLKSNKRALLIGINYIDTENALNGCINDVVNMKDLLIKNFGFKNKNIYLMSDDQKNDFIPTKNNIIKKINEFVDLTKPGDLLFIHYSGHGSQIKDNDGDEKQNQEAQYMDDVICPCDFLNYNGNDGLILDDYLKINLVNKIPIGAKLRVFFDCCFSGSALDLPYSYRNGINFKKEYENDNLSSDCLLISGCKDNQTSADAYLSGKYSGALTWSLLNCLPYTQKIPTTWCQLLLIIRYKLDEKQFEQIPMLSVGAIKIGDKFIDI